MVTGFEAQTRQVLDNVKAVVEAAGLTMEHVVYTHICLRDMARYDDMNRVYGGYFPNDPPARAVLGIAGLRGGALIDMKAVAVRHPIAVHVEAARRMRRQSRVVATPQCCNRP